MQYDFIDQFVLGFFITTIFKEKIHVSHVAFEFLYEKLGPYLQRQNTHMREYFNWNYCCYVLDQYKYHQFKLLKAIQGILSTVGIGGEIYEVDAPLQNL